MRAFALSVLVAVLSSCSNERHSARAAASIEVVDDAGDTIQLARPAQRIVSLDPGATETIVALGAGDRVVGRTRLDVVPEVANVASVGGGADPSVEAIVAQRPDLVIAWDTNKRRTLQTRLRSLGITVYSFHAVDTNGVFRGIARIGRILGRDSAASALASSIRAQIEHVRQSVAAAPVRDVMFVIYPDPPMVAGSHTFVDELIGVAGGHSTFADSPHAWPSVSMEEIVRRRPGLLIVSDDDPNAINHFRQRAGWRELYAVREGHIATVPANLTQRPGPHIGDAAVALQRAIHPETVDRK